MQAENPINKNRKLQVSLALVSLLILFSSFASAVPNSLTLQGKLTNNAGASQSGLFNFTFKIYDASTDGNLLWDSGNYSITTDANGVYDVILQNVNLSFADQYYLGITVGNDAESAPRINLTASPYSFRANTSEGLNANNNYFVNNLTINGNATIGNGISTLEINSQAFNLTKIGKLYLANNFSVAGNSFFIDGTGSRVGIGTASPNYLLQVASGTDGRSVNLSNVLYVNGSSGNVGIGTTSSTDKLAIYGSSTSGIRENIQNVDSSGFAGLDMSTPNMRFYLYADDGTNTNMILTRGGPLLFATNDGSDTERMRITETGIVGINTTAPAQTLDVKGTFNVISGSGTQGILQNSAGNVGIGTTTPSSNLQVAGNSTINNTIMVSATRVTIMLS